MDSQASKAQLVEAAEVRSKMWRDADDRVGGGVTVAALTSNGWHDAERASLGDGTARSPLVSGDERTIVYLPEGMKPWVLAVRGIGGDVEPAPTLPRSVVSPDRLPRPVPLLRRFRYAERLVEEATAVTARRHGVVPVV